MTDQQNLYTLAEATELTGLSTEALRLRVKRGKLAAERGNDGQPRIRLTVADLDEFRRRAARQKSTLSRHDANSTNIVKALQDQVETLREALVRERERADQMTTQAGAERARVEMAEREREAARIQAAAAEAEVRGLRETLAEARRPFWRRWLGG